jgi:hypothetical protein
LGAILACGAFAPDASAVTRPLRGLALADAISRLRAEDGLQVLFSTDLVAPGMRVLEEPRADDPQRVLQELLAPHGLQARELASGRVVVTRAPEQAVLREPAAPAVVDQANADIPEIVVTASRYLLVSQIEPSLASIESADLQALPDIGDDPLRALSRLPGTANNGLSGKFNVRGGEVDETLVRFDDLRLYNPFHLKDFQSLFSAIDPALVRTMNVYTGGFPVGFGDRMSGVIDIDSLQAPDEAMRVVSASLFSAGLMAADRFNDGRSEWLVSARRGNVDLLFDLFDPDRGKPRYHDLHARFGQQLSENSRLRASVLRFDDNIEIADGDQEERATADYEDSYYWLTLDWQPAAALDSRSTLGYARLTAGRDGTADQPGISVGELHERRESRLLYLQSDWQWQQSVSTALTWGGELRSARGSYEYDDEVHFDILFDVPGAPAETQRSRSLRASPNGSHLAAYMGLRQQIATTLVGDAGLRWEHDSLPDSGNGRLNPRAALLWQASAGTQLRLALGRFSQFQSVEELQLNDGISAYFPGQTADHAVASLRHRLASGLELRAEFYEKRYRDLRPRFENLLNAFVILPELKPDRIRTEASEARARGAEISLVRDHDQALDWWLTYGWSSVRDEIDGEEVRRGWDQTHSIGAGISWSSARWDVSIAGGYHTGWPTTAIELATAEPQPIATTGPRNGERFSAYRSLDLRVARRYPLQSGLLTVFLEVSNLTNRRNECCRDYEYNTEEGTPVLETEDNSYLPILPNLGVIWEF